MPYWYSWIYTGQILNIYINNLSNGCEIVATSLMMTGIIFLSLSAYVNFTKKDFSFYWWFCYIWDNISFCCKYYTTNIINDGILFSNHDAWISSLWALLMCGLILFQTSAIIHGGEDNYVMVTVTLYISIYNLFTSLLHIFASFMGR